IAIGVGFYAGKMINRGRVVWAQSTAVALEAEQVEVVYRPDAEGEERAKIVTAIRGDGSSVKIETVNHRDQPEIFRRFQWLDGSFDVVDDNTRMRARIAGASAAPLRRPFQDCRIGDESVLRTELLDGYTVVVLQSSVPDHHWTDWRVPALGCFSL